MSRSRIALLVTLLLLIPACTATPKGDGGWGGTTNEHLAADIDRRVAEIRYMNGVELLDNLTELVSLKDQAAPAVRHGLQSEDWLIRLGCAYVAMVSEDRRYIPYVLPLLDDPMPDVRYEAAGALVEFGDGRGFWVLVEGLADADLRRRSKCIDTLRRAVGRDFGFVADATPSIRAEAVLRWEQWLEDRKVETR